MLIQFIESQASKEIINIMHMQLNQDDATSTQKDLIDRL